MQSTQRPSGSFNRRGDSLGGAASLADYFKRHLDAVSIAGAILWGVLPNYTGYKYAVAVVSIAGAILWGVLHMPLKRCPICSLCFNRRGDSLGGAATKGTIIVFCGKGFNRRGDSLGGAANQPRPSPTSFARFNRRGDSLGGAAHYRCTL